MTTKKKIKSLTGTGLGSTSKVRTQSQISPVLSPMLNRNISPERAAAVRDGQKRAILKSAVKKSKKRR